MLSRRREQLDYILYIDLALLKLKRLVGEDDFCKKYHGLNMLKVELRLVKTFLLCANKLGFSIRSIQEYARENLQCFYPLQGGLPLSGEDCCFQLKSFGKVIRDAYVWMSDSMSQSLSHPGFLSNTKDIEPSLELQLQWHWKQRMPECYYMLDCLLELSSSGKDEFLDFFHSLLENFEDNLLWGEARDSRFATLLKPLQEKLVLLKDFICFVRKQGKHKNEFMKHCGVVAVSAAHLCFLSWFFRDDNQVLDGMDSNISESVEKINPVADHARLAHTGIRESGSSSLTLSTKMMTFIDSILDICKDDRALNEFKVEIRLVKTNFLCARKLCHPLKNED